jgi:hypothetical protein
MRTYKLMNRAVGTSLSLVGMLALGGCTAVQPKPECKAQTGDYAARYTLVDMSTMCEGKILTGETISVQYYGVGRDANGKPKLGILASRAAAALALGDEHGADSTVTPDTYVTVTPGTPDMPDGMKYTTTASLGPFASKFPNDKNICSIGDLGMASVQVPAIPEDKMADPPFDGAEAIDLAYTWTNLNMLVTPTSNAVYFGADLELKDGECTATYKVTAISPAVSCEKQMDELDPITKEPVLDPDGHPVQVGSGEPDDEACEPSDDNGLNVDIDYECDAKSFLCVPANDYPMMKSK